MKIIDIQTYGVNLGDGNHVFVKVISDEHIHGIGEAYRVGPDAAIVAVIDDFKSWLIGEDPFRIEHLWRLGRRLQDGVRAAIENAELGEWVSCSGAAPWTIVSVREPDPHGAALPAKSLLQQEMLRRGVLFNGSNFISYAHTDADIDAAVEAYAAAFRVLARALPDGVEDLLEGPALTPAFRTPS